MKPEQLAKSGTEYGEQCALFAMCALHTKTFPELRWFHAIENEEKSGSAVRGARSRAAGKRKGVADTCLPVKRGGFSGLYIELKTKKGKPSKEQIEFGEFVTGQGFSFQLCYGWESAWFAIVQYLNLK
jgi:hypothetical protein